MIDRAKRVYGPPAKLKTSEPEVRIVASYGYGGFKWEHPKIGDIIDRDLRKKRNEHIDDPVPGTD